LLKRSDIVSVLTPVHATYEHRRVPADLTTRAEGTQAELGAALRGKDDADAVVHSLRERIGNLEAELAGLGTAQHLEDRNVAPRKTRSGLDPLPKTMGHRRPVQ
jgi:hypothetical protein